MGQPGIVQTLAVSYAHRNGCLKEIHYVAGINVLFHQAIYHSFEKENVKQ